MVAMVYCRGFQLLFTGTLLFSSVSANLLSKETPSITAAAESAAKPAPQVFAEPIVARVELRLTIGDKEVDVIEKGDKSESIYINRATAYLQMNMVDEAINDYSAAIQLNDKNAVELTPDYALTHQNLGWLLATSEDESLRDAKTAIASATKACELNEYNDLSDLAALAASHAAAKEFSLAIGLQEKIVERAAAQQKPLAEKLLELYRNEKPFDPDWKVEPITQTPNSETKPDANQ